jgi:hypothetical protein
MAPSGRTDTRESGALLVLLHAKAKRSDVDDHARSVVEEATVEHHEE